MVARRYQFGLRTLLAFLTVCALLLVSLLHYRRPAFFIYVAGALGGFAGWRAVAARARPTRLRAILLATLGGIVGGAIAGAIFGLKESSAELGYGQIGARAIGGTWFGGLIGGLLGTLLAILRIPRSAQIVNDSQSR